MRLFFAILVVATLGRDRAEEDRPLLEWTRLERLLWESLVEPRAPFVLCAQRG